MDPQKTGLAATSRILFQTLTPLVWKFPDSDSFFPGLATQWQISPDGNEYTFSLRNDVRFDNGEPFNADSVTYTFDRMKDPQAQTLATVPNYDHSEKIDDYTVKLVFSQPYGPFLALLSANVAYMPIPPTQARDRPDEFGLTPAGTGPFTITEYVPKSHATLARNPNYNWAPSYFSRNGPGLLNQINWRIVEEPATRVATLQSGECDMVEEVAPALVSQIENDPQFQMIYKDTLGCPRTVMLNNEKFPTNDPAVRQAMSRSTRSRRARSSTRPAGTMNSATGVREKNGQPLNALFIVVANDNFDEAAQVIQSNFKDVGINLELRTDMRIMAMHILPNVAVPILVLTTVAIAWAILIGASLSFLGLGAQPPFAEWGRDLSEGRNYMAVAWWVSTFPGLAILLTILSVNLLGDGLRDTLDPRLQQR